MNHESFDHVEVDCDGSACGSGRDVGRHIHPPQAGGPALGRVIVRDHQWVGSVAIAAFFRRRNGEQQ